MAQINNGTNLNSVPSAQKQTLQSNYIDFTDGGTAGWAQQYLPDLMEEEAEVFGNRSVSGFLEMVGAEEAMTADQVIWSEQGRLHLSYKGTVGTNTVSTIQLDTDVDGNDIGTSHGVRIGDTVLVTSATLTAKCYVSGINVNTDGGQNTGSTDFITVAPYAAEHLDDVGFGADDAVNVFVFGSEFAKGRLGREGANVPAFKSFTNKPIILKDKYEVSGSDASQIGWVEVSGEEGQNGYLWYLKAAGDTRSRFTDYCEMSLIEAELATSDSGAFGLGLKGTEGLFAAVTDRGNIAYGFGDATDPADTLVEFDAILAEFDRQGAIEEYMMFLNRSSALAVDDMLAAQNSYGEGGTSYGVFDNDEDMAINLGFSGFRRGSYDFYKTDWKYLNDAATRGGILDSAAGGVGANAGEIKGMFVPAGTSTVYDQTLGRNLKRPFLHVRYRASQMEDRRFKTWTTGSVGAATSDLDAMEMHFLTERCLVVQGANNFMMLRG